MAQGGLRPSVIPAHERESRRGGGDGLPSARERRSIVWPSGERSEEESQAVLVPPSIAHVGARVGCPARCRAGGSRTAHSTGSFHRHFRPRILRSAARKNPRRYSSASVSHPESVAQRDVGEVREPPLRGPIVIPATERASKGTEGFVRARRTPRPLPAFLTDVIQY